LYSDIVYIGAIHTQHVRLCKLALHGGKHVLCEKPLGMNVKETKEILELAKAKGLFLMEAVWSRFFPAYKRLKEELEKGTVGEILQVLVSFGDILQQIPRME
jgi:dihydrodiol dehydrogenase / D-xylose 1-dehydrogenase (NADP)